jgi:hypothetical protein
MSGLTVSVRSKRWVALQRSIAVEVLSSSIIFPLRGGKTWQYYILVDDDPADVIVLARHINENEA